MRSRTVLLLALLVPACGATDDQLRARAAFDMNCDKENIEIIAIDAKTRGVRACGQQAT